mgnify:CR=1 FL=1
MKIMLWYTDEQTRKVYIERGGPGHRPWTGYQRVTKSSVSRLSKLVQTLVFRKQVWRLVPWVLEGNIGWVAYIEGVR